MANEFPEIVELMSSWTGPQLPPEFLKLRNGLIGQTMERDARLELNCGVYEILGSTIPPQCLNPKPALRRAMREVSVAFYVLDAYRQRGIEIEPNIREPLVCSLTTFFNVLSEPHTVEAVQGLVDQYLVAHSVRNPVSVEEFFRVLVLDSPLLDRLRAIHRECQPHNRRNRNRPSLDDIGLLLDDELDDGRCQHATPLNARTFASTGGNGVHFSLLIQDGVLSDDSPVVVTVPVMGSEGHAIVGENFQEFLNLGYHAGYFSLARFIDDSDPTQLLRDLLLGPAARDDFDNDFGHAQPMMQRLREEFELRPWSDANRFRALQETYKPRLRLPPEI